MLYEVITDWFGFHDNVAYRGDAAHRGVFSGEGPKNQTAAAWTFKTGYSITGSAVAIDDTVFIGSLDRKLYALDSSGQKKWEAGVDGSIYGSPAPDGKRVVVADTGGVITSYSIHYTKLYDCHAETVFNPDSSTRSDLKSAGRTISYPQPRPRCQPEAWR